MELFAFDVRPSDSPHVERVWTARSERAGEFLSVAAVTCELVVSRYQDQISMTVRGPETGMTSIDCPVEGEWIGIRFNPGTFLSQFPPGTLRDHHDVTLPDATTRSFWLNGSAWDYPTFDNADTFVARLLKKGLIARDGIVDAVVRGEIDGTKVSRRTAQRRFLRATGLTHGAFRQIERARYATHLLRDGIAIADVVHLAGFFDQPHLTRSLKQLIGQTPTEIARHTRQLSLLYKTPPPPRRDNAGHAKNHR
jgi:AraC-like DNA-binding protein